MSEWLGTIGPLERIVVRQPAMGTETIAKSQLWI
jgi:hypothetical protein